MTNDGLNRLANLFANDISSVLYKVDTVEKEVTPSSKDVVDNTLDVILFIETTENGNFTDFKIKGITGIILTERNITFTKTEEGLRIVIPFKFLNVSE